MTNLKEKQELLKLYEEQYTFYKYNRGQLYYTDDGKYFEGTWFPPRAAYKRYLQFFAAGKYERDRAIFSGNRVGKTEGVCGYECYLHATGEYPFWWEGKRFHYPPTLLICGNSGQTVRDILQKKLLGKKSALGTGLIPKDRIIDVNYKSGTAGAIDTAMIRFGDYPDDQPAEILFRAYGQDREVVEGIEADVLWVDEEAGMGFFNEAHMRLFTKRGISMMSFTPLKGFTETVKYVIPNNVLPVYDENIYKKEVDKMMRLRDAA